MLNFGRVLDRPARALVIALSLAALMPMAVHAQNARKNGAAPASSSTDYKIGPGDELNIFVWGQKDLSAKVPVRPDGKISTPLVEDMVAVGKTPSQLGHDIEKVLSEYIRSPHVTVIVEKSVGTFASQIRVLGQVMQPGAIPYRERMTLLDVMLQVGGLTDFAAGNRSKLIRTENGKRKVFRVRLGKLLNDGDLSQNMPVRPGDVISVPKALF